MARTHPVLHLLFYTSGFPISVQVILRLCWRSSCDWDGEWRPGSARDWVVRIPPSGAIDGHCEGFEFELARSYCSGKSRR